MGRVELRSKHVRLVINPVIGGRIEQIIAANDQWLFFDETRALGGDPRVYDEVWCGGFEELFPNDAPGQFEGQDLPDHGELWNTGWEIVRNTEIAIALRCECKTFPAVVEKSFELHSSEPRFSINYKVENRANRRLYYLFKLHPAMRIESGDEILLPGGSVNVVDPSFSTMTNGGGPWKWPWVTGTNGERMNVAVIPGPESKLQEFLYVTNVPEGWCGLRRVRTGKRITFRYPSAVLPFCWLFMTYGGWRNYYTVVLEPCTNMPKDLAVAKANGTCAILMPGEEIAFAVEIEIR